MLALVEEEGAERASYALKLLQSEGEVSIASTGKDASTGRLVTREYRVTGPVALFLTTTAIDIDEELLNRCLVLTVDENRDQTRAIHARQRQRETLDGILAERRRQAIIALHRNAQRLLRPLTVVNPYAERLTFSDERTRTRRDHMKYLALIRTVALLHQFQREHKTVECDGEGLEYIEVTLDDIAIANRLAHEILGRSVDELPPQTRRLLLFLDQMVGQRAEESGQERQLVRFSRRDLREATGWGDTQLKCHLARLVGLEYLLVHRVTAHKGYEYELLWDGSGADGTLALSGLMDPHALDREERSGRGQPRWVGGRASVALQSAVGRTPSLLRNPSTANGFAESTVAAGPAGTSGGSPAGADRPQTRGPLMRRARRPGDLSDPDGMARAIADFCTWLRVRNYREQTVRTYETCCNTFAVWLEDRDITRPGDVTRQNAEQYQTHLHHRERNDGQRLSAKFHQQQLGAIRQFFRWAAKTERIPHNPTSELELPRLPRRLPRNVLTAGETEIVLTQADVTEPLGLRDRAMMETLYSTGIRRAELAQLRVDDLDPERGTLLIQEGKDGKDRIVPIGERAVAWIDRYLAEARPFLAASPDTGFLFINNRGDALGKAFLTHLVRKYIDAADIGKSGSCHVFRHTMATVMLEGGADIRHIQSILGHANLDSTEIYTHVAIRQLKAVHSATHPGATLRRHRSPTASSASAI